MNYTTLKADVAAYLHRTDLTTQIPDFIEHARVRLGLELRALCNQTNGTVTSFSNGRSSLPTNFGAAISVWLDTKRLQYVPPDMIPLASSGVYSIDGGDLLVPEAGSSTSVSLSYWAIPAALVNGTDVSEGMAELPQIWRYAAVREGAIYVQDWELAGQMDSAYRQELQIANRAGRDARFPKGPAMNDQVRDVSAVAPEL